MYLDCSPVELAIFGRSHNCELVYNTVGFNTLTTTRNRYFNERENVARGIERATINENHKWVYFEKKKVALSLEINIGQV